MVVTGVQGADALSEFSVFNVLNVDFEFANALPCFKRYFLQRSVSCVYFHTSESRLYYLLRRLDSSLLKVKWSVGLGLGLGS